ncbi:MAG: hypothetical protein H8E79_09055 [Desulfobulbaceae bacterium]|uniref:Uncharacterized protein n=1 Tax=Candidatus Desulfatifera sulfidica TaxID=2841691 RepID=A0A8J6N9G1_9BACT|nr:hypothetical protein [Candidatus Desulfatifera sulfidica]
MAEIKSTMEMVMERAARIAARTDETPGSDNHEESGMRLAARFMNNEINDLGQALSEQDPAHQMGMRRGMAQTLLRNIVLPRDEMLLANSLRAMQGLLSMEQNAGDMATVCGELQQILEQYGDHKTQMKQQLEDAIRTQLEQKNGGQTALAGEPMAMNPALHPQFQTEWAKMLDSLNSQYGQALDQRKDILNQRFS